jgi:putative NADH-flavin reductase
MKKIALFGGSGKTGSLFLEKALADGYAIQALVRTPAKISLEDSKLEIIKGDVLNANEVEKAIANTDAVVSLFGHVKSSAQWLQTQGTENIVKAMQTHNLKRIISLSGGGLPYPEKDEPKLADKMIRLIMKVAVPKVLNDAIKHHKVLQESNLDWTVIRGPRLTDDPETGNYRQGWVGVNASTKIGRADLADFILKVLKEDSFKHQMPFVSY